MTEALSFGLRTVSSWAHGSESINAFQCGCFCEKLLRTNL